MARVYHTLISVIMAAENYSGIAFGSLEISSYVRGHHIYKNVWEPMEGEVLSAKK